MRLLRSSQWLYEAFIANYRVVLIKKQYQLHFYYNSDLVCNLLIIINKLHFFAVHLPHLQITILSLFTISLQYSDSFFHDLISIRQFEYFNKIATAFLLKCIENPNRSQSQQIFNLPQLYHIHTTLFTTSSPSAPDHYP